MRRAIYVYYEAACEDMCAKMNDEELKETAEALDLDADQGRDNIINALGETLRDEAYLSDVFALMMPEDLGLMRQFVSRESVIMASLSEELALDSLYENSLVYASGDIVFVPVDIVDVFAAEDTDDFKALNERLSWLDACEKTAALYYGVMRDEDFLSLYNTHHALGVRLEDLEALLDRMPESDNAFVHEDGLMIAEEAYEDKDKILAMHAGMDVTYPDETEIHDIAVYGYPYRQAAMKEMFAFLSAYTKDDYDTCELMSGVWEEDVVNGEPVRLMQDLALTANIPTEDVIRLSHVFLNMHAATRKLTNNGATPGDMIRKGHMPDFEELFKGVDLSAAMKDLQGD